ncbi:hypothetical protein [Streptococcus anginosus]|uniref:hypothetical protein n=1 Tax=Streptococcus anginosus TaxID=1328 RepID=UPI002ED7F17D
MATGKHRNPSNRNQDYMASSEPNSPTKTNMEYPNTPEKQDLVSKSYLIMMLEDFKKDVKNSLRETQENINKQVEAYREESQKCLKEFQENINKQVEAHREEVTKIPERIPGKHNQTVEGIKNGNRSNQERTHGNNPGYRKPKEETRSCRYKLHQQNTRDGRENLRSRRFHRNH